MTANTKIEWVDHTWNPWVGCAEISPACDFCYARVLMQDRFHRVTWGSGEDRVRTSPATWAEPARLDRLAKAAGRIDTVFCLSLGDIWDKEVDPAWRREAFDVMRRTPNLLYLLLSKRIGNAERMCDALAGNPGLPENAALGATLVNQDEWDRDMPKLRSAAGMLGARFGFVSVEPMLGPIRMGGSTPGWVICGGESGPNARPMHPDWARGLRDQCKAAGVPFFFKQWGEFAPDDPLAEHTAMCRLGKHKAGALLDGIEWREGPSRARARTPEGAEP
jgi:protein gp37